MSAALRIAAIAALAFAAAGCAEATGDSGRYEGTRTANTVKQAPPSMTSAQAVSGKGRAGEHKTMMHHH